MYDKWIDQGLSYLFTDEKGYGTITFALKSVSSVLKPGMSFGTNYWFLPQVTFRMISTFVALVPIIDCSEAVHVRSDLTEVCKDHNSITI